jgi:hypothetical protein
MGRQSVSFRGQSKQFGARSQVARLMRREHHAIPVSGYGNTKTK